MQFENDEDLSHSFIPLWLKSLCAVFSRYGWVDGGLLLTHCCLWEAPVPLWKVSPLHEVHPGQRNSQSDYKFYQQYLTGYCRIDEQTTEDTTARVVSMMEQSLCSGDHLGPLHSRTDSCVGLKQMLIVVESSKTPVFVCFLLYSVYQVHTGLQGPHWSRQLSVLV